MEQHSFELNPDFKMNSAFEDLYKEYFPYVRRFIINNNGTETDAEDIFQDTMIIFLEKLRMDDFIISASVKAYIMGIAKNIWLKKIRNKIRIYEITEDHSNHFYQEIDLLIHQEKTYADKLIDYMHKITNHCKGLIHDMFFKNKSIEQIQIDYGYKSRHNAVNQKYKCVEQIRKLKDLDRC